MPHLIIDGYNLIRNSHALLKAEYRSLEKGRLALMKQLAHYRAQKGYPITVVFDAALTDNTWIEEDRLAGIQIFYSEHGQTADEIVISLARQKKEAALVVSSDREIMRAARSAGSGVLTSEEFVRILHRSHHEIDTGGTAPMKADPIIRTPYNKKRITQKKGPSKRLPKAKRQALAKIKNI